MPIGHPLKALVVYAHFKKLNRSHQCVDMQDSSYFLQPEVAAEILDAWSKSIASPEFRDESRREELSNLFAAALYLTGHWQSSREALAMMDGHCLPMPWCMMSKNIKEKGNPGWVVQRVSAELMTQGGAA